MVLCDAGTILHVVPVETQSHLPRSHFLFGFFPPDAHGATFPDLFSRQGLTWPEDQEHGWAWSICLSTCPSLHPLRLVQLLNDNLNVHSCPKQVRPKSCLHGE